MDTLTIELKNPIARKLIDNLVEMNIVSIKQEKSWLERWEKLSKKLPKDSSISEEEILNEISNYRNEK